MVLPISRRSLLWSMSLPLLMPGCTTFTPTEIVTRRANLDQSMTRIALGSCLRENRPQPIWREVRSAEPELFIHLGDNIYGDTANMSEMRSKYGRLWGDSGYQALRRDVPVIATWDDHDFGKNNAGVEFSAKAASKEVFCDFFGEPATSERRRRPGGIYTSYTYGPPGRRLQIILLDVRYDRTTLRKVPRDQRRARKAKHMGYYRPDPRADAHILGADQWRWLEGELRKPAEVRLIASGTRVLAEETGHEQWANFPGDQQRLFDLIRTTGAAGVIFASGDPHFSEYSKLDDARVPYPLWDMTSSALNQYNRGKRRNIRRVVGPFGTPNFGMIEIDWAAQDPLLSLTTRDLQGVTVLRQDIRLGDLRARVS